MSDLGAITSPDEYPHGLRCMNCGNVIEYSDAHVYRTISDEMQEVWCVDCAVDETMKDTLR